MLCLREQCTAQLMLLCLFPARPDWKKWITENIYGPNQRAGGVSEERKNNTMKEVCSAFAVALDMSSPGP